MPNELPQMTFGIEFILKDCPMTRRMSIRL